MRLKPSLGLDPPGAAGQRRDPPRPQGAALGTKTPFCCCQPQRVVPLEGSPGELVHIQNLKRKRCIRYFIPEVAFGAWLLVFP